MKLKNDPLLFFVIYESILRRKFPTLPFPDVSLKGRQTEIDRMTHKTYPLFSISTLVLNGFLLLFFPTTFTADQQEPLSCDITVDAGPDQVSCVPGGTITLSAQVTGDFLYSEWSGGAVINNPDELITNVTVDTTTTFVFTAAGVQDQNLIVNGDFSQGNVGFTSDYTFDTRGGPNLPSGNYGVDDRPDRLHSRFANCQDQTGDSRQMIVNGSGTPDNVWCQNITVSPNTDYAFSAWAATVFEQNPAQLQFTINGATIGDIFVSSGVNCDWEQFYAIWNSGNETSAQICLANVNATDAGNDFSVDGISLQEVCLFTDTVTVTVVDLNESWNGPLMFCQSEPAQPLNQFLSSTASVAGNWEIDGVAADSLMPANLTPGSHQVTYSVDDRGCTASFIEIIEIDAAPRPGTAVEPIVFICEQSETTLPISNLIQGADPGGFWSLAASLSVNADTSQLTNLDQLTPGSYEIAYVQPAGANCPEARTTVSLVIQSLPVANAGDAVSVDCLDNLVSIGSADNFDPSWQFSWSSPDGFPIASPDEAITEVENPGTYILQVTDTLGCSSTDEVTVGSNISTVEAFGRYEFISCEADQTADIIIDSIVGGQPPYEFARDGVNFSENNRFADFSAGSHSFVVRDANFCEATVTIEVPFIQGFSAELLVGNTRGPVIINIGDSLTLNLETNKSINELESIDWFPAIDGCDGCLNPTVQPDKSTNYRVRVTDVGGCVTEATLFVEVSIGKLIYVPDIFTPNDDGINDRLVIYTGNNVTQIKTLSILDRWGDVVYEVSNYTGGDPNLAWNGRAHETKVAPGVYLFMAEIALNNGSTVFEQGSVTVVY